MMAIPTECKMPDLSGLDSPLMNRLLAKLLVGEQENGTKVANYIRNFIRLIDKALREYNEARNHLLNEVAVPKRSLYVIGFTDHMENCINAISRLFRLLDRINSEKDSPQFPRSLRRLLHTKNKLITDLRNSVEHIDKQIQKDEIFSGNPVMITYNKDGDGIAISKLELKHQELASVLTNMNEIALYLLQLKTTSTRNTST
jgi:hypothetical protein